MLSPTIRSDFIIVFFHSIVCFCVCFLLLLFTLWLLLSINDTVVGVCPRHCVGAEFTVVVWELGYNLRQRLALSVTVRLTFHALDTSQIISVTDGSTHRSNTVLLYNWLQWLVNPFGAVRIIHYRFLSPR